MKALFCTLVFLFMIAGGEVNARQALETVDNNDETRLSVLKQKHIAILEQDLRERKTKLALGSANQDTIDTLERSLLETKLDYEDNRQKRMLLIREMIKFETTIRDRIMQSIKVGVASSDELLQQEARLLGKRVQLAKQQRLK